MVKWPCLLSYLAVAQNSRLGVKQVLQPSVKVMLGDRTGSFHKNAGYHSINPRRRLYHSELVRHLSRRHLMLGTNGASNFKAGLWECFRLQASKFCVGGGPTLLGQGVFGVHGLPVLSSFGGQAAPRQRELLSVPWTALVTTEHFYSSLWKPRAVFLRCLHLIVDAQFLMQLNDSALAN